MIKSTFPLSPQQKSAWRQQGHARLPNVQIIVRITGPLTPVQIRASFETVCERHEILRTRFRRVPGVVTAFQSVCDEPCNTWNLIDLEVSDTQAQLGEARRRVEVERQLQIDLENGPLVRGLLLRFNPDLSWLGITAPAILLDRRSLEIVVSEIASLCSLQELAPQVDILQYVEYSQWQADLLSEDTEHANTAKKFWAKCQSAGVQKGEPLLSRLPNDYNWDYSAVCKTIHADLVAEAARLRSEWSLDLPTILEAVWVH